MLDSSRLPKCALMSYVETQASSYFWRVVSGTRLAAVSFAVTKLGITKAIRFGLARIPFSSPESGREAAGGVDGGWVVG
jgi:hypothetical protein